MVFVPSDCSRSYVQHGGGGGWVSTSGIKRSEFTNLEAREKKQRQTGERERESSRNLDQNLKERFKKCYKTPRQEHHAVKKHKTQSVTQVI